MPDALCLMRYVWYVMSDALCLMRCNYFSSIILIMMTIFEPIFSPSNYINPCHYVIPQANKVGNLHSTLVNGEEKGGEEKNILLKV